MKRGEDFKRAPSKEQLAKEYSAKYSTLTSFETWDTQITKIAFIAGYDASESQITQLREELQQEKKAGGLAGETIVEALKRITYLEEQCTRLVEALEYYADKENHYHHAYDCDVSIAQKALASVKEKK